MKLVLIEDIFMQIVHWGVFLYLGLLGVGVNLEACQGFVRVFVECTPFDVNVSGGGTHNGLVCEMLGMD